MGPGVNRKFPGIWIFDARRVMLVQASVLTIDTFASPLAGEVGDAGPTAQELGMEKGAAPNACHRSAGFAPP